MKPSAAFSIYGFVLSVPNIWQGAHIARKAHLAYDKSIAVLGAVLWVGTLGDSKEMQDQIYHPLIKDLAGSLGKLWALTTFSISFLFSHSLNLLLFLSLAVLAYLLICIWHSQSFAVTPQQPSSLVDGG